MWYEAGGTWERSKTNVDDSVLDASCSGGWKRRIGQRFMVFPARQPSLALSDALASVPTRQRVRVSDRERESAEVISTTSDVKNYQCNNVTIAVSFQQQVCAIVPKGNKGYSGDRRRAIIQRRQTCVT